MIGPGSKTADRARPLLVVVIAMGVLIVIVTTIVIVKLVKDIVGGPAAPLAPTTAVLHEPAGSHIVSVTAVNGRLSVLVEGGGPDRVLLVDPGSGQVSGTLVLGR